MKKVSKPRKIEGKKGWWVDWRENGKRKRKCLPDKKTADDFWHRQYHRLNSDVYVGSHNTPWPELVADFLTGYDVKGRSKETRKIAETALARFKQITFVVSSADLEQRRIDKYVLKMKETGLANCTINKDIQRIQSFLRWCLKRRHVSKIFELDQLPVCPPVVKALTNDEIRRLIVACPTLAWRVRILLSLCTGLRASNVDKALVSDLDLSRMTLAYIAVKTGKEGYAPIPDALRPILTRYEASCGKRLFSDRAVRTTWENIRLVGGFYQLKGEVLSKKKHTIIYTVDRKDFRRTFSTLVQKTEGLSSARALLQHSSDRVTLDHYTDIEVIQRYRVNQLPVEQWIEGI